MNTLDLYKFQMHEKIEYGNATLQLTDNNEVEVIFTAEAAKHETDKLQKFKDTKTALEAIYRNLLEIIKDGEIGDVFYLENYEMRIQKGEIAEREYVLIKPLFERQNEGIVYRDCATCTEGVLFETLNEIRTQDSIETPPVREDLVSRLKASLSGWANHYGILPESIEQLVASITLPAEALSYTVSMEVNKYRPSDAIVYKLPR